MKAIKCNYESKNIIVKNFWFKGLKLFIDDKLIAENKEIIMLDGTKPAIMVEYPFNFENKKIEVFCEAIYYTKIKIKIDGIYIGGAKEEFKNYSNTNIGKYYKNYFENKEKTKNMDKKSKIKYYLLYYLLIFGKWILKLFIIVFITTFITVLFYIIKKHF